MCRYLGFYQQSEASIAITHPHARKSVAIYRGTELWITSITPSLRCVPSLFHANMADAHLYDIVVNTAVLGLESVVDVLVVALELKVRRPPIPTRAPSRAPPRVTAPSNHA